jgi:tRNA A-37 threonylcarbamoyl transferase component Bud32
MRRYRIEQVLGRGGFGTVYKAMLTAAGDFQKPVALKVLNEDMVDRSGVLERLKDEARLLGLLHHRAIVQVDGLARLDGRWAVVMEYVEGVSLRELLSTGPIPVGPTLLIAAEVSGALDAAWRRLGPSGQPLRLLHRDIKPSNIQLTPNGDVKLLDFGVARADLDSREAETKRHLVGSLPYMAPERFELDDGPAGDVYSLGVSLCELLGAQISGRTRPRPDEHARRVDSLVTQLPTLPPSLRDLLLSMLAYEPADRPGARDCERMATQLFAELGGGLWLHDYAENAVPPVLKDRPMLQDVLTGTLLAEAEDASAQHTFLVPFDEPKPAQAPEKRGGLLGWLAGGGMALGLLCAGSIAATVGGTWALTETSGWQEETSVEVDETLLDMKRRCSLLPDNAETRQMTAQLEAALDDPTRKNIGLFELASLESEFDGAVKDGFLSEPEMMQVLAVLQDGMRDW